MSVLQLVKRLILVCKASETNYLFLKDTWTVMIHLCKRTKNSVSLIKKWQEHVAKFVILLTLSRSFNLLNVLHETFLFLLSSGTSSSLSLFSRTAWSLPGYVFYILWSYHVFQYHQQLFFNVTNKIKQHHYSSAHVLQILINISLDIFCIGQRWFSRSSNIN